MHKTFSTLCLFLCGFSLLGQQPTPATSAFKAPKDTSTVQAPKDTTVIIYKTVIGFGSDSMNTALYNYLQPPSKEHSGLSGIKEGIDLTKAGGETINVWAEAWKVVKPILSLLASFLGIGALSKRTKDEKKAGSQGPGDATISTFKDGLLMAGTILAILITLYWVAQIAIALLYLLLIILALIPVYAYVGLAYIKYYDDKTEKKAHSLKK